MVRLSAVMDVYYTNMLLEVNMAGKDTAASTPVHLILFDELYPEFVYQEEIMIIVQSI